jgi:hypothetical protein
MLIQAQMVPLPVTAAEKFREAVYFFNRMVETQTNVYLFPFHFSAFLSSLRSVTFYLQAQFKGNNAFETWYERKQEEMRNDPLLRMLKEMRDEALHARPIELQFLHGPTLPEEGIETTHFAMTAQTDNQGEVRTRIKIGIDGEEREVPPVVHWVVDLPDEISILQACDSGLRKIQALLEEWHQQPQPTG